MSTSFRQKVQSSAKLSSLKFTSEVGFRLISTVVLTRLLAPEIYGVFAIVLVYLYLLDMFSDLGVRSLVLTKENDLEDDFLRTCWTVSILRGAAITLLSGVIALAIWLSQSAGLFAPDSAYSAAVLPLAIATLGLVSFIEGFQSPLRYVAERNMTFGRTTLADITATGIGLIATITLAFWLRSVWALVFGKAITVAIQITLSFLVFKGPRMWFCLDRGHLKTLIDRGKWIIGNSILTALAQSADRLVLGFVMTSSVFGFYFIARQIIELFARLLTGIDNQMGLQVFTHLLKSAPADFRRNYYRYRLFFDGMAGTVAGGLLVTAPLMVDIIFDDRYSDVSEIIQLLAISLLLIGPWVLRAAYSAERRFGKMAQLTLSSTLCLWIGLAISIFVFQSITAALLVIALQKLPEVILLWRMAHQREWLDPFKELRGLGFIALGAGLGWVVMQIAGVLL